MEDLKMCVLGTAVIGLAMYSAYCFWTFICDVRRRGSYINKLPGLPPHWLLGHIYYFPGPNDEGLRFAREVVAQFPRLAKVWYGPFIPGVVISHPETIKVILQTSEPKARHYRFLSPWLGDGLLLSSGKKWHRNRRLLTPAFHFDILKPYVDIYNRTSDIFLSKISKYVEGGESFDVFSIITLLTLDILLQCAFSHESGCQLIGENHPYVKSVTELNQASVNRFLNPLLYVDLIYNMTPAGRRFKKNCDFVHTFSQNVIEKRKKVLSNPTQLSAQNGKHLDFLDILLTARDEEGQGLTDREIRDEVDTFMFEGHDTTASGIAWCLLSLAKHPEHQARCQQEIDEVLRGRDSDTITWEDLPKLKYLTMCIKESLRLHPPVGVVFRELTKDVEVDGFTIPAGTTVEVSTYMLHHNPTVWENSTEYRPERFLPDNIQKMDNFAFVPFSAGPRNCIGQSFAMHEMKLVVSRILRRFTLEPDLSRDTKIRLGPVVKADGGIWMKVHSRQS